MQKALLCPARPRRHPGPQVSTTPGLRLTCRIRMAIEFRWSIQQDSAILKPETMHLPSSHSTWDSMGGHGAARRNPDVVAPSFRMFIEKFMKHCPHNSQDNVEPRASLHSHTITALFRIAGQRNLRRR